LLALGHKISHWGEIIHNNVLEDFTEDKIIGFRYLKGANGNIKSFQFSFTSAAKQ